MKKINLFKVVMFTLLTVLVLTWIIPASSFDGTAVKGVAITPVPLFDLFANIFDTLAYFSQIAIFALVVGGFYGVLNATDAYSNLLHKIVKKFKGMEKQFIGITIIVFALLAAFISLPFALFAFIPMFASIILLMGYDKLTALAATVGAVVVGMIGSIYGFSIVGNITKTLSLDMTDSIVTKIVLLVLGVTLLIFYVINRLEKVTSKTKAEELDYDPLYSESKKAKTGTLAMIITLSSTFLFFILGFITWSESFGIKVFTDFDTWFKGLELFGFPIMKNIFGGIAAFGAWSYSDLSIILVLMTLVMVLIYNIKLDEYLIAFFEGTKKLFPTAAIIILAISVLVLSNANSYSSIVGITPAFFDFFIGLTKDFNMFLLVIPTILGAIISVDAYYFAQFGLTVAKAAIGDASTNSLVGLVFQTMYGFAMLFAPTSLILLAGLSYLDVPYTKWIKYIAMFLLQIFIVIMAMLVIVMLAA